MFVEGRNIRSMAGRLGVYSLVKGVISSRGCGTYKRREKGGEFIERVLLNIDHVFDESPPRDCESVEDVRTRRRVRKGLPHHFQFIS